MSGSTFKAQVATVMSGTALAQLASLLLMPQLTRLYEPTHFGVLAVCLSFTSMATLLVTLRLENALLLPKEVSDAKKLLGLAVWSTLALSILFFLLLRLGAFLLGGHYAAVSEVLGEYAHFIALTTFIFGVGNILNQWLNRLAEYKISATKAIIERLSFVGLALVLYNLGAMGLVLSQLLCTLIALTYGFFKIRKSLSLQVFSLKREHLDILKKYIPFSTKHGAGTLLMVAAWQVPPILIASWFPMAVVGQYNLATRYLEAPLTLLGNSFSGVFYRKLSETESQKWQGLLNRALKPFLFIPPLPILLVIFVSPQIFSFVFGSEWRASGVFFACLAVLYWFRLLYIVCSPLYLVLNRLGADMWFAFLLLVSQTASTYIGYKYFGELKAALIIMSILTSAVLGSSIIWVYRQSGKPVKAIS